ncbi:MAG: aerobic carbon-monoxide dehydrogenase large subunit [Actinomycetota bacterium]|jgi:carbon-monoxide dehydrogenase large subunit|nr:aerobic carbon-monoxide dehydrogenase large subunit [Actinomycetota bacterium]
MFGVPHLRSEDPRFIRGEGRYLENIDIPGALRAVFVRSMMPHARLNGVDVTVATGMPGVAAVYVATDLEIPLQPPAGNIDPSFTREALARDVVRFVGEPVAVVVAETFAQAQDAAEVVWPDYDPLEAVTDPEAAELDGAPQLWPEWGSNIVHRFEHRWDDDPLAGADVVARGRFVNQRVAPASMETNGIAVIPEEDGTVTVWVSSQVPFDVRTDVADVLGLDKALVRTIAPDVGGGFGAKLYTYPEYLAVAKAAMTLGRPVRWTETRSENLVNMTHGRAQVQTVEIGAMRDGTVTGVRVEILADMGAYPIGGYLPTTTQEMLSGVYRFPVAACRGRSVVTNTTPVNAYRGAGRPEATACIERAMDLVAAELGMDPVEIRRRNLIPPDAFPYTTSSGTTYDTGDYLKSLDTALELADYAGLRREQAERRARGDHLALGIGLCTYVEITAFASKEFGSVEVGEDGIVAVVTGVSPQGQGHETAMAQIASAILDVPFASVRVVHSDTGLVTRGAGTWGSRSLQVGGSAVAERADAVVEQARSLAAHLLEVDLADLVAADGGGFAPAGAPDRRLGWSELASAASDPAKMPEGMEAGLRSAGSFRETDSTFPFGTHIAVVEVDTQTGEVDLIRHIAVDDCGRILNPLLVQGQVHGGLGQGIAQALYEEVLYDESANPVTGTFSTYLFPAATEFPRFTTANTETPTPLNPLGAKGIGESATIGSTPAIQNAAVDALAHLGIRHLDLPVSPGRVTAALRIAAEKGRSVDIPPP